MIVKPEHKADHVEKSKATVFGLHTFLTFRREVMRFSAYLRRVISGHLTVQ